MLPGQLLGFAVIRNNPSFSSLFCHGVPPGGEPVPDVHPPPRPSIALGAALETPSQGDAQGMLSWADSGPYVGVCVSGWK